MMVMHNPFFVPWKQLLLHTHTQTTHMHTHIHTCAPLHTPGMVSSFCLSRSIQPMDYVGNTYFKVKGEIIQCEKYLMKALGVCVHVQHPHKVVVKVFSTQKIKYVLNYSLSSHFFKYWN